MKVQSSGVWQKKNEEHGQDALKHKRHPQVSDSFVKGDRGTSTPAAGKVVQPPHASLNLADVAGHENKPIFTGLNLFAKGASGAAADMPASTHGELRMPSLDPAGVAGSSWQKPDKMTLFPNGMPAASDIQQHGFGDCYLIATMSSMASSHPQIIQQAITPDPNDPHAYNVKMYDPSGAPITVAVNDSVAVDAQGNTVSTTGGDGQANWASIAEKAYAKYTEAYPEANEKEGYNPLADGGDPSSPMRAFTGQDAQRLQTTSVGGTIDDATLAGQLQESIASGRPVVADTAYEDGNSMGLANGDIVVGQHAYTVSQVYQDSAGDYRVQVRNPWGLTPETNGGAQNYDKMGDGVIDMSMREYQMVFNGTTVGGGGGATTGVDMNTRNNAYGAEQIAQHKDPDNTAVYNNAGGQYTVVAGKDAAGVAQIQVFDGKGDKDEEFNYKGSAALAPNTSYLVVDHYINVDANGKPTVGTEPTNKAMQAWDVYSGQFKPTQSSSLNELNNGYGPH